jgi:hypothetical protein
MATTSTPITPERFALAIHDLPLPSLHAKAAEIRNAIAHLVYSNEQLRPFADDGERDCAEAIAENEEVMQRMRERIDLLRAEVEGRGMRWAEGEVEDAEMVDKVEDGQAQLVNGTGLGNGSVEAGTEGSRAEGIAAGDSASHEGPRQAERLSDEELQRRLIERLGDPDGDDGVHL